MGGCAPAGLGAACGVCLAQEEALAVRLVWAEAALGMVCVRWWWGTGYSAECWGMVPAVTF